MNIVNCIVALLAGVGVFIVGMNTLSSGLEHTTGSGLKRLLGKISNNRFAGVGVGASVTALIQSSSATSVMAIGFVNAGTMTLRQATAIIMGANIGTTVTGLIVSLSAFDVAFYATALAFVGVMMTFFKHPTVKNVGGILCGLGLLFIGLDAMSSAFSDEEIKIAFIKLFSSIDFPLLLILCGVLFTALIQSSSASTGLIIIMVGSGALSVSNALFIVLGSNIGTCVTAIVASIGTTVNAKRTAFIHLIFNVIGVVVFTIVLWALINPITNLLSSLALSTQMQIAIFHVVFNVTTTFLLLPFIDLLVKLSEKTIKEKKTVGVERKLKYVDALMLKTPAVALMQVKKEIEYMSFLAKENLSKGFYELCNQSGKYATDIAETESIIDFTNSNVTKFLIDLTSLVDSHDEKIIGSYFHVVNDIERIGDLAENFLDVSVSMKKQNLRFSPTSLTDLEIMHGKINQMFALALEVFDNYCEPLLSGLSALENEVDKLKKHLTNQHFARLAEGTCQIESSAHFSSCVAILERIGDHLINIGYSIINPVGTQTSTK